MADLTLGLDLGPNSIGWALIEETPGRIVAAGVRVFPEGVDRDTKGGEISKNEQRRLARGMRRQIARRARRKQRLRQVLVEAGLLPDVASLPADDAQRVAWESDQYRKDDPISLRRRGLFKRLEPHELGRVFVHLNQRRGFLSNRKTDRARKEEASEILQKISELAQEMGNRTLGQFLAELRGDDPKKFHWVRLRGRHTRRDMYEKEFNAIWTAQQKHHPGLLTDELRNRIHRTIFFQRDILPPSPGLVGRCELEPRLPRCPRADRRAQRFRLFQEVNNLRVIDTSAQSERKLAEDERRELIEYLRTKKERKFDDIRRHLFEYSENIRFNLERAGRTKLFGMPTDAAMAKMIGKDWHKVPEVEKDRIVAAVIDDDEKRLRQALRGAGLEESLSERLLDQIDFEEGYASYSLHALKKLLPYVERGLPLTSRDASMPCALREADYILPWEQAANQERFLPEPPKVTNPLVGQALQEVRKVVNAILRELVYKPGHRLVRIHIELAREVKGTARQRDEYIREMRQRENARDGAAERLRKEGIKPTREAIDRYLLWKEQDEICIYSGLTIGFTRLFGGDIDIDHVLPRGRSLDNSMMNKVVCLRSENSLGVNAKAKGDRTPFEWLAESNPPKYEQVLQRARKQAYTKLKRFYQKTIELDDFFARQFVDTTYITTQVSLYVRCLGADILCPKGQHTAELRHQWGLDTILQELGDSPAWEAAARLPPGEKNRLDHRHHAIDALVIALTNQSRLQQLARIHKAGGSEFTGEVLPQPWPAFRRHVEDTVKQIRVSHRVRRRVSGALHEDTTYGPTAKESEFVVRKQLSALTCSMVPDIRDPMVKQKVIARLKEFGIEPGRGQEKIPAEVWEQPLWMNERKNVPINKVRLIRREATIRGIRGGKAHVKPGSTHHVCFFEIVEPDGRRWKDAIFVSMLDAIERVQRHEPVIEDKHPTLANAKFLFSISPNEMVLLTQDGTQALYRFETAASTTKQMWFRHHTAGGKAAHKIGRVSKKPSTFEARKITVDPIGRIRWAND
jgi:CRISPR-associated endonuclease Csn1